MMTNQPTAIAAVDRRRFLTGVALWTRLVPELFEPGGGMPSRRVSVGWQVAGDERFVRR
jgi:phosphodiesterase/alkaline phosphatase D-like protein